MTAFCARCKSDFPIGEGERIQMGQLTNLDAIHNSRVVAQFTSWRDHEDGHYLCGNCYFDLTDDE